MADASKAPTKPSTPPSLGIIEFSVTPRGTALIGKVDKYGSAGKSGILAGDEIIGLNGAKLPADNPGGYTLALCQKTGYGGTINVHILRGGKQMVVAVKLIQRKVMSLDLEEVSEVLERKISPSGN